MTDMQRHLYRFGFCTPSHLKGNQEHGWDDEDSACVFIEASTADQALGWGIKISEAFVQWLFKDAAVSWTAMGFARWIEEDLTNALKQTDLANVQSVALGEFPDFAKKKESENTEKR